MTLRIAVITDIHYGMDIGAKKGSQALNLVDQFIDAAHSFGAHYIFNLGDDISTRDPVTDEHYKQTLRQHFNRAACPIIKIDGNHCVRFQEKQSTSRSFQTDSHHIVLWNPYLNRYTRDGVIPDPEDIEWLESELTKADKPAIILSHVPFRGPESERKQFKRAHTEGQYYPSHFADAEKLQEIIESSGKVILCLSGHRHLNHIETMSGVHHTIQQSLVEIVEDGKPAGAYSLIEIDQHEIRINGFGLKQPPQITLPLRAKPLATPAPQAA
jgi:hypothetical protein